MTRELEEQRFRDSYKRVFGFFKNRGLGEEAQELTQETYLRAYRSPIDEPDFDKWLRWLFTIARNVHNNALRDRAALKRSATLRSLDAPHENGEVLDLPAPPKGPSAGKSPEARLLDQEQHDALAEAVAALPPRMQACLLLRVEQELKIKEIAGVRGIKPSTADDYLDEAKARLRKTLGNRFGPIDF